MKSKKNQFINGFLSIILEDIKKLSSSLIGTFGVSDRIMFEGIFGEFSPTKAAFENNWVGIITNGFIRDVEVIQNIDIGMYAMNSYPKKTDKSKGILKAIAHIVRN